MWVALSIVLATLLAYGYARYRREMASVRDQLKKLAQERDALADRQVAMIAQNCRLVFAKRVGDSLAFRGVEHDAGVVVKENVIVVEGAGVLSYRVEQPPET